MNRAEPPLGMLRDAYLSTWLMAALGSFPTYRRVSSVTRAPVSFQPISLSLSLSLSLSVNLPPFSHSVDYFAYRLKEAY